MQSNAPWPTKISSTRHAERRWSASCTTPILSDLRAGRGPLPLSPERLEAPRPSTCASVGFSRDALASSPRPPARWSLRDAACPGYGCNARFDLAAFRAAAGATAEQITQKYPSVFKGGESNHSAPPASRRRDQLLSLGRCELRMSQFDPFLPVASGRFGELRCAPMAVCSLAWLPSPSPLKSSFSPTPYGKFHLRLRTSARGSAPTRRRVPPDWRWPSTRRLVSVRLRPDPLRSRTH